MSYRVTNVLVCGLVGVVALCARDVACVAMGIILALAMVLRR